MIAHTEAPKRTKELRRPGTIERAEYLQRAKEFCKRGWDLPQTKLPPLAIKSIRDAAVLREKLRREITEKYSNEALAKAWGVHPRTIEKVLRMETHIDV